MVTLRQIELVQNTCAIIAPHSDDAAALFYGRLFERNPGPQPMFKGDMAAQRRKLMQMLDLGRRHVGYGVPMRTTTPWAQRCSGHSGKGWARLSPPKSRKPGPRSTGCWLPWSQNRWRRACSRTSSGTPAGCQRDMESEG